MTLLEAIVIGLGFAIGFYSFIIVLTMVLFLGFLIYGYVSAHREDKRREAELKKEFEPFPKDDLNIPAYIRRQANDDIPF